MPDRLQVVIENGKYTFRITEKYEIAIDRYEDPEWVVITSGNKAMIALLYELDEARKKLKAFERVLNMTPEDTVFCNCGHIRALHDKSTPNETCNFCSCDGFEPNDEPDSGYDFSSGERGKYAGRVKT